MNQTDYTLIEDECGRHPHLAAILKQAKDLPAMATAVVHPTEQHSLRGALASAEYGLIDPILVGPEFRIRATAEEHDLDISQVQVIDTEHSHASAAIAVELCRTRKAGALMKGALETNELLSAVLNPTDGIRGEFRISHVWVMDIPTYHKALIVTDAAINIQPTLAIKRAILINAIQMAKALGLEHPKVAILAAVEMVNPEMPSTIDAAALCKMADRHQLLDGAIVDGPLAFDNAISLEAAITKNIQSPVSGDADILLAPDLEAANILGKQLLYLANAKAAGVVLGARQPIILTSRSETLFGRLTSCALARLIDHQALPGK